MAIKPNLINQAKSFINILNSKNIHIDQAFIFGSQAKGTAHEYSDIDLALVSGSFSGTRILDNEFIIDNTPNHFYQIETHPYTPQDFTIENPFVREIIETGIRII